MKYIVIAVAMIFLASCTPEPKFIRCPVPGCGDPVFYPEDQIDKVHTDHYSNKEHKSEESSAQIKDLLTRKK
jgi:hypothetical protein